MSMELKMNGLWRYVQDDEIHDAEPLVKVAQDTLESRKGAGNDFLGWLDLPENYDREEFAHIKQAAEKIRRTADVLIVIGIGGSYLGARAAIEFVKGQMYNQVRPEGTPEVYFAGNNISSSYLNDLVKIIGDRDFCINVISKSGTTTEPAIAFRILRSFARKNTAARARRSASLRPRTRSAARSSSLRTMRATRPSSCRTTSAVAFLC